MKKESSEKESMTDLARRIAENPPTEQQIRVLKLGASAASVRAQLESASSTVDEIRQFLIGLAAVEQGRAERDAEVRHEIITLNCELDSAFPKWEIINGCIARALDLLNPQTEEVRDED